jgi:hypothetical protein
MSLQPLFFVFLLRIDNERLRFFSPLSRSSLSIRGRYLFTILTFLLRRLHFCFYHSPVGLLSSQLHDLLDR